MKYKIPLKWYGHYISNNKSYLNKSYIEFGVVQIGKTAEEELIISNLETVPAHFTIERKSTQPGKQPNVFFISNLTGDIPPKSNYLLKIFQNQ